MDLKEVKRKVRKSVPYTDDLIKPEEVETAHFQFAFEAPTKFFIKYIGQQTVLELSGVGKIVIGQEYEVSEKIANSVRRMPDWVVIHR